MLKNTGAFQVRNTDGETLVSLSGEIDHHNAVFLRTGIDKLIREKRPKKIVLDLSAIRFMDSSGLGLIMGRFQLVQRLGGELILRNPNEAVLRICRLVGMERIIKIETGAKRL